MTASVANASFRWRDSAHGNKKRVMSLPVDEFLRRFLLHLLPRGFVRIRNFGFLANRQRATLLPLCFSLLGSSADRTRAELTTHDPKRSPALPKCPLCSGTMYVVERLSSAKLLPRSPPQQARCAV
nr:transposase [Edaphobacter modestus]